MFRHVSPLFEEKKDPPGDPPPAFTAEQQAAIGALISGAMKGEGKRQIAAAVTEAIGGLKLGETIAAEVAKLKPAEPEPKPSDKPDARIMALETQLKELDTKYKAADVARVKAEEKSRDDQAYQALRTALTPHVRAEALDIAAKNLFLADKRVTYDDQGNPLLTVRKAPYPGVAEEDTQLPLADGVKHWIGTPEGKFFAPAPGGTPDNTPRGGAPRRVNTGTDGMPTYDKPATTDGERDRRAMEREAAARQKYPEAF